jgi:parvulin-like peptidyl-prolyl isomerase
VYRSAAIALTCSFAPAALAQAPVGPPPPPPARPAAPVPLPKPVPGPPGVAALVNGEQIPTARINALVAPRLADEKKQYEEQATELLVNNMLVDQEAKKEGITVTPAELDTRMAEVRKQFASDPRSAGMTLESLVAKNHETMATLKDSIRLRLLADKLVGKNLPPVKMVHAEYLLVATNNPRTDPKVKIHTDADALKVIAKAQDDLKAGKSFEDVVKLYSDDPSTKDKGGDLGLIGGDSGLDPNFLSAALALKKGEVTPTPVKAPEFGYFLIKAVSTSTDPLNAAEKVQYQTRIDAARQAQSASALPTYLQGLRQKAKVTIYDTP